MIKPPDLKKTESQIYYLKQAEAQQLLHQLSQPKKENAASYLISAKFRLEQPGKNQKCPAEGIKDEAITKYTSEFSPQKYAPFFKKHGSITAASIKQLREALTPLSPKTRSPSTPPHICIEVKTKPDGKVEISAWDPFSGPPKK